MKAQALVLVTVVAALFVSGTTANAVAQQTAPVVTIKAEILGEIDRSALADSPNTAALEAAGIGEIAVEGATIEVKNSGAAPSRLAQVVTDRAGNAQTAGVSVSPDAKNPTRVDIVITAPGYAPFTYLSLPLYPGSAPILTPVLSDTPTTDNLGTPVPPEERAVPKAPVETLAPLAIASCTGYTSTNTPPNVIKVFHNNPDHGADYSVHTVDFLKYVQHVLPREWTPTWDSDGRESLRAGAIAVKMYGWYHVLHSYGGTGSNCYDVDSTTSLQVWDPYYEDVRTNYAVLDTWDYYLMYSDGTPYNSEYRAGWNVPNGDPHNEYCGQLNGGAPPGGIMSQWGSWDCAKQGYTWSQILSAYYFNPVSIQVHGPHAVGSSAEGLPPLVPLIRPRPGSSGNTQARIRWDGEAGVAYYFCYKSGSGGSQDGFFAVFNSCSSIGTDVDYTYPSVPTTDQAVRYYRIKACKDGYCSATRGGALEYRDVSGNWFYATVGYNWLYGTAYVTTRNLSWTTLTDKLYDGAYGFGGVRKKTCSTDPGTNCGPESWTPSSASYFFASGTQTVNSDQVPAILRVIPKVGMSGEGIGGE